MEYFEIANTEKRIIKIGLEKPERYVKGEEQEADPWWNVYVYVKIYGTEFEFTEESMVSSEINELIETIERSKNFKNDFEEELRFMEPDHRFLINKYRGIWIINLGFADSLHLFIERDILEKLGEYLKNVKNEK